MITIFYQFVQDLEHENVALYVNGKLAVDYDDYINVETGMYILRALNIEFQYEYYTFNSDLHPNWNGFTEQLSDIKDVLVLSGERTYTLDTDI